MMLARQRWQAATIRVLEDVFKRRVEQEEKYPDVNDTLDDGSGPETRWLLPFTSVSASEIEARLRHEYEEFEEETGKPTWVHLVREEVAEAFMEDDPVRLADELLDVAALCVSWVERLRARTPD